MSRSAHSLPAGLRSTGPLGPSRSGAQLLLDFHDHLLDRRDYFIDLLQGVGKARLSAAEEVLHVALTARYYGRTARRYLHSERGEGLVPLLTRVDRHYVPKGLVGSDRTLELSADHGDFRWAGGSRRR